MIRKATLPDIDAVLQVTSHCANFMMTHGIFQWNEHYPSKAAFETDVKRDELYVLELEAKIIGCIVISTVMDDEYIPVEWLTKNNKNLYIHRLAVLPELQGQGYAQRLMDFAEAFGREHMHDSIRLDTFSQNTRNQRFYEQRGYQRLGTIYFPKQSEHPFYCYELIL